MNREIGIRLKEGRKTQITWLELGFCLPLDKRRIRSPEESDIICWTDRTFRLCLSSDMSKTSDLFTPAGLCLQMLPVNLLKADRRQNLDKRLWFKTFPFHTQTHASRWCPAGLNVSFYRNPTSRSLSRESVTRGTFGTTVRVSRVKIFLPEGCPECNTTAGCWWWSRELKVVSSG